jgi:hypothetical protein
MLGGCFSAREPCRTADAGFGVRPPQARRRTGDHPSSSTGDFKHGQTSTQSADKSNSSIHETRTGANVRNQKQLLGGAGSDPERSDKVPTGQACCGRNGVDRMLILPNPAAARVEVDLDFVRLFHRAGDGYVTFHRLTKYFPDAKTAYTERWTREEILNGRDEWEDLFAFQAAELDEFSQAVKGLLGKDSHFVINGLRECIELDGPLFRSTRARTKVWWLNAVWVDLDFRKRTALDYYDVVGKVQAHIDSGDVPVPSIVTRSSEEGMWLFWLLEDEKNPGMPVPAYPSLKRRWEAVQNELHEIFAPLGSDPNASDMVHTTRISGSWRTDKSTVIAHSVQIVNGACPVYTLPEISKYLLPVRESKVTKPNPNKRRGYEAYCKYLLEDFEKVTELRGDDCGRVTGYSPLVSTYAGLLRVNGFSLTELERRVFAFGRKIGWGDEKILKAIEKSKEFRLYQPEYDACLSKQQLANWLDVTASESEQLKVLPPASRFGCPKVNGPSKADLRSAKIKLRLATIQTINSELESPLPVREMVARLSLAGMKTSKSQVGRDYLQLGVCQQVVSD